MKISERWLRGWVNPDVSSDDDESAREFVRLVDAAVQDLVGPTAVRGSRRMPVAMMQ